jgi:putative nucleotidyltransferase with HDIG domain
VVYCGWDANPSANRTSQNFIVKKRILFVDDEPMILDGLKRMLRPLREEWEMVFVTSGIDALKLMSQTPFDVVVSDMRMPQMNGAELLAEVLKRHPQTVRLILSGHADQDLILKCVGSTHQYLAKPCRPDDLKAAIERASDLNQSLKDKGLRQLISCMQRVPSMPLLYLQIVEKLQDPEIGLDVIGDIIGKDLGMTAKILKLVNSSFFGLARQISSPAEAVSQVGAEMIKSLVLSVHAFSQFETKKAGGFSIDALWQHSQKTARLAQAIARMEDCEQKLVDEAFVGGLLHDIGKLVLASSFPDDYARILKIGREGTLPLVTAEENTFGANHAEVGGYLLGLWGLPVPVVEAIALHHNPTECTHMGFSPLTAVHAANALVNFDGPRERVFVSEKLDSSYLKLLGLDDRLQAWRSTGDSET